MESTNGDQSTDEIAKQKLSSATSKDPPKYILAHRHVKVAVPDRNRLFSKALPPLLPPLKTKSTTELPTNSQLEPEVDQSGKTAPARAPETRFMIGAKSSRIPFSVHMTIGLPRLMDLRSETQTEQHQQHHYEKRHKDQQQQQTSRQQDMQQYRYFQQQQEQHQQQQRRQQQMETSSFPRIHRHPSRRRLKQHPSQASIPEKTVTFRSDVGLDDRLADDVIESDCSHGNGLSKSKAALPHRQSYTRFELVEDRFLALNPASNSTHAASPRPRLTHSHQSLSRIVPHEDETPSPGTTDVNLSCPVFSSQNGNGQNPSFKSKKLFSKSLYIVDLPNRANATPPSKPNSPKVVVNTDTLPVVPQTNQIQSKVQARSRTRLFESLLKKIPQRRATLARIPDAKDLGSLKRGQTAATRRYSESLAPSLRTGLNIRRRRLRGDVFALISTKRIMPLLRFKKAVRTVVLLLRAVYTDRERTQRRERQMNIWIDMSDSGLTSRRAYETYGLTFDPQDFKANRQIQVTSEAKSILSTNTDQRSTHQVHSVLVSLRQAVPEFSEFPITMQESLARVGWYERFEAKRVIIRQGHMADNFYFILSGTAVVIILETDKVTGQQKARTAAILGRGRSFGELALMHKARRSATVTCREEVELLAVGRDDFVDIFMHVERGVEPEHVRFLRVLPIFKGWPLETLPYDNPNILLFTYVRRGVVLCSDSNTSEWIFVIKSGHCRIIKCLPLVHVPRKRSKARPHRFGTRESTDLESSLSTSSLPSIASPDWLNSRGVSGSPRLQLPFVTSRSPDDQRRAALLHVQTLDSILQQRHAFNNVRAVTRDSERHDESDRFIYDDKHSPPIFVQVLKLGAKDIYGMEASVFDTVSQTVSTSLVSDGAELIMINRKFFMDHTSSDLKKYIRKEVHPLPSEDSLQVQLKTQMEWDSYRCRTLRKTMGAMKLLEPLRR